MDTRVKPAYDGVWGLAAFRECWCAFCADIAAMMQVLADSGVTMTLVVGYADEEIGFLVGETLLSHQYFQLADDVGPVNSEFHSLKIQILSGNIAVAAFKYRDCCDRGENKNLM
ncbi:MAG TPA: hypothetical protein VGO49_22110 [Bradyrhizobium sp.]|jgi:hypothetical protein|nr:hypothetical protein [Bradyrhizobium sp.]